MRRPAVLAAAALLSCAAAEAPQDIEVAGSLVQGGLATGWAPPGTLALSLDGKAVQIAERGDFILGFDRDQPSAAVLEARLGDGRTIRRVLAISARQWRVEHVNVARRPTAATPGYLRLREGELARIAAARRLSGAGQGWRQRFTWPAQGRISGAFGSQRIYRGEPGAYHSGVDIAAGAGAPVTAPADGLVVLAGPPAFSLEGNLVIIDHGMGLNSAFLHLAASSVTVGQRVRQGETIGIVGATGRATGPHLHWSVKWNGARLDPAALAGSVPRP